MRHDRKRYKIELEKKCKFDDSTDPEFGAEN